MATVIPRAEADLFLYQWVSAEAAAAVGLRVAAALADLVEVEGALAVEARAEAGNPMRTKEFLSKLEHDQIVLAIRNASSEECWKAIR